MFKKLATMASAVSAFALVALTQVTMSASGVVALESADTTAIGNGITSGATSLIDMAITLLPYIVGLTVVLIIYKKVSGFGKLRR